MQRIPVILVLTALAMSPASAEDFFEGKTISIIVAAAVGTGQDVYARFTARHLSEHIPGKPAVVVKTMVGAAGRKASEYLANQAPKDGTEVGAIQPESIIAPLYEKQRYDLSSFVPLGSALAGRQICVTAPGSKIKTFRDTNSTVAVFGGTAVGGAPTDAAQMIKNLTVRDPNLFKIILGYPSSREIFTAMERGEVDGLCGIEWSSFVAAMPEWVAKKSAHILLQTGPAAHAPLPVWGAVDDMRDYMTAEARAVAEFIVSQQGMSRPYFLPAGVDSGRAQMLKNAFAETWQDPAFVTEMQKANLDVSPVTAEKVATIIKSMAAAPKELIESALQAQR